MPPQIKPYWTTGDGKSVRLYHGHVIDMLDRLPARSVQCVVTSPPYWGLRDYGTGTWEGGKEGCDHKKVIIPITGDMPGRRCSTLGHNPNRVDTTTAQYDHQFKDVCGKCGARRVDNQLGSERIPDCLGWARGKNCAVDDWENGCHVCVDEETEILTDKGWKRFNEIQIGDTCAQYDSTNLCIKWGEVKNLYVSKSVNEDWVLAESGRMSMLVTKNHRCLVMSHKTGRYKFVNGSRLKIKSVIPISRPWDEECNTQSPCTEDMAELLGWYLSEGNHCWTQHKVPKRHSSRIEISQSLTANAEKCKRIESLLTILNADWSGRQNDYRYESETRQRMTYTITGKVAYDLIQLAPNKKIPTEALKWKLSLVKSLLSGLIGGDGHIVPEGRTGAGRTVFAQKAHESVGLVQALWLRCGISSVTIPLQQGITWQVYTHSSSNRIVKRISSVKYTGVVWCPQTEYGTWVARRKGHVFITGNCRMVVVFDRLKRVLRNDGVVWLNYGDTYGADNNRNGIGGQLGGEGRRPNNPHISDHTTGLDSGNLVGVPWRVAFALQADGWILRQDIIWAKPSPMPESVTNRCTKAHEYLFLLTKSMDYYWDQEAIKEPAKSSYKDTDFLPVSAKDVADTNRHTAATAASMNGRTGEVRNQTSNKRSVWTISSKGYPGAHYATFPPDLVKPCILAATSEKGCCPKCGTGWVREVTKSDGGSGQSYHDHVDDHIRGQRHEKGKKLVGSDYYEKYKPPQTKGWKPGCHCGETETVPCVVLDPFIGSGTTAAVAIELGRSGWGVELNEKYLRENAIPRIRETMLTDYDIERRVGGLPEEDGQVRGRPIHNVKALFNADD